MDEYNVGYIQLINSMQFDVLNWEALVIIYIKSHRSSDWLISYYEVPHRISIKNIGVRCEQFYYQQAALIFANYWLLTIPYTYICTVSYVNFTCMSHFTWMMRLYSIKLFFFGYNLVSFTNNELQSVQ